MIKNKINIAKKAQEIYSTFSQSKVDFIFKQVANEAYIKSNYLAKLAVKETKMGNIGDKTFKNVFASRNVYEAFENEKTCDVIYDNPLKGIRKIACPVGVIAGIIPCTNPTSTTIYKSLLSLKTRNALVVSPHPRALECTKITIELLNEAAVLAGAPQGLLQSLDIASVQSSKELMQDKNISMILATGGHEMVNSAYSSGHPAIGVGSGNTPVIIDDSASIFFSVHYIIKSKSFDNGLLCPSEQCIYVLDSIYNFVKKEFINQYCYFTTNEETEKIKNIILKDNKLNPNIIGKDAQTVAEIAGFTIPKTTKIIFCEVSFDINNPIFREKLCPILGICRVNRYSEALDMAKKQIELGGMGHTATLYTNNDNILNIRKFQETIPACRLLINQPSVQGALGYIYNPNWKPSLMMGCGTWGNTSYSGNIVPSLLLNTKNVITSIQNN